MQSSHIANHTGLFPMRVRSDPQYGILRYRNHWPCGGMQSQCSLAFIMSTDTPCSTVVIHQLGTVAMPTARGPSQACASCACYYISQLLTCLGFAEMPREKHDRQTSPKTLYSFCVTQLQTQAEGVVFLLSVTTLTVCAKVWQVNGWVCVPRCQQMNAQGSKAEQGFPALRPANLV